MHSSRHLDLHMTGDRHEVVACVVDVFSASTFCWHGHMRVSLPLGGLEDQFASYDEEL